MKVTSTQGKEPPFIKTKKELTKYPAREEWKKLITKGWRKPSKIGQRKEVGLLILDMCSNNTQLLTNSDASSKRFILLKLFLPKSKSINLPFLLKN